LIDLTPIINEFADYITMAEILTQRPIEANGRTSMKVSLSAEELKYLQDKVADHFDKVMAVVRDVPRPMLLVIRYLDSTTEFSIMEQINWDWQSLKRYREFTEQ
jgi:hypothetical protein